MSPRLTNHSPATTLSPTPPTHPEEAADRIARHMRLCAELADLAMQLARVAAARALANWAEPESPPAEEPSATAAQRAAPPPPTAKPRAASHPAGVVTPRPADPAVLFTRLAAVARHCIALEARLAATATAAPSPKGQTSAQTLQLRADPRRALLRDEFARVIKHHPDRAALQREITTRLDELLAADPDQTAGAGNLFFGLCAELGIEVDLAKVPDSVLNTYRSYPRSTAPP